ncbi:accessory gene regulator B family protein [Enterococcus sp. AZ072]|uniref:accessory gene regulator B family protein n=1 Tax=unclassified Enterococcus TaxID=2608891 RepID=UPI003D2AFEE0
MIHALIHKFMFSSLQLEESLDNLYFAYCIECYIINFMKACTVYLTALFLFDWKLTLITHLSFLAIRKNSFGWHSENSFLCSLVSVLFFSIAPNYLEIFPAYENDIWAISLILILLLAPGSTASNPIISKSDRKQYKAKSLIGYFFLFLLSILIPEYKNQYLLGMMIACFLLLLLYIKNFRRLLGHEPKT